MGLGRLPRDENSVAAVGGVGILDEEHVYPLTVDEGTGALLVTPTAGSGNGAILDGANSAIKATVLDLTGSNPLTAAIVDGDGNQITSFGGGTQYADGAARGTATGTLSMVDDGANIQSLSGDSAGRANINTISGQTGIQGGSGVVTANTTRVAIASDANNVIVNSQTFTKKTVTASSSGNNTIHTPGSGLKIRLHFFGYSAGSNVTGVLAGIRFAASGTIFDQQYLVAPGQPYARNIQAGKRYIDGGIDEALIVNLSAAQTVYTNVELEEV